MAVRIVPTTSAILIVRRRCSGLEQVASASRTRRSSHSLAPVSESERLIERFIRLCEIPSPTGSERRVGDAVTDELRALGVDVTEDGAAEAAGEGAEAHAGIEPEAGRSAIVAACAAVAAMKLGRLDPETTANVGTIAGGTAANVVPGRCRIEAEARSLDEGRAGDAIGAMADACAWAAS